MTIQEALAGCSIARIDAEVLLAHALGISRTQLFTNPARTLSDEEAARFHAYVVRRHACEPVAYITGTAEFYGRPFHVTPDVIIPRPATEILVEEALRFLRTPQHRVTTADTDIVVECVVLRSHLAPRRIVDIGTGSGCIAITMALEGCGLPIDAVDTSREALQIAAENAATLAPKATIAFTFEDGVAAITRQQEPFLIVSNPPYIPEGTPLIRDVGEYEPVSALFSGPQGDACITRLRRAASDHSLCTGIVMECMSQHITSLSDSQKGTVGL